MTSELEICAAAFFRIKGKEVVTEKEFTMSLSLDLKWMSVKESDLLMKKLITDSILIRNNGYLKPGKDLSTIQVPIAYRPSSEFKKSLQLPDKNKVPAMQNKTESEDVFVDLMNLAVANGIQKGKFVSECNNLKKTLGVNMAVAALISLRDNGIDTKGYEDRAYAQTLNG